MAFSGFPQFTDERIRSAESYTAVRARVDSMSAVAEQRRMLPDFKTNGNGLNETEGCRTGHK